MGLLARLKTWIDGEILTHTDLNAEVDNILDNLGPTSIEDASVDQAAMDAVIDPYPGGSTSLPTTLLGELKRLRYISRQQHGTTKWYIFPDIQNIISTDSPFSATQDHRVIKCDAINGVITVNLPSVGDLVDKVLMIKKTDSSVNAVTIDGNGAETIDGATTYVLNAQYDSIILVSDGVEWHILADTNPTLTNKTLTSPIIDAGITINGNAWPSFRAEFATAQIIASSTTTKVAFDSEVFDTNNNYDPVTNYRFSPTVAGKYLLHAQIQSGALAAATNMDIYIYKNGVLMDLSRTFSNAVGSTITCAISTIADVVGTEYFEVYTVHNASASNTLQVAGVSSHFTGCRIG